jgi:LmbE family N-acetylglucosaminyl deacetylase
MLEGNVIIVAAHPDDEVLGMGATINKLINFGNRVQVLFLSDGVSSRNIPREDTDARQQSAISALEKLGCKEVYFTDFPDNQLDTVPLLEICKVIENRFTNFMPETVFTHFPFDLNIDHQLVSEAVTIASRPKSSSKIKNLFYFEVLSSTGWKFGSRVFSPNLFIEIDNEFELKLEALQKYQKEMDPYPNARSLEAIEALAILRGASAGKKKSEAFEVGFIRK